MVMSKSVDFHYIKLTFFARVARALESLIFPHISYFFHVPRNLSEIKYDLSSYIQNHLDNCYSLEKIFPISGKNFSDQWKNFFRTVAIVLILTIWKNVP